MFNRPVALAESVTIGEPIPGGTATVRDTSSERTNALTSRKGSDAPDAPDARSPTDAQSTDTAGRGTRRVLVVEDDVDFAESLVDVLLGQGYTARATATVDAALRMTREFEPDVALIDVRLGRADGVEALGIIKAARPATMCVMMTAYASVDSARSAFAEGAREYLRKPLNMDELFSVLDRSFERLGLIAERARAQTEIAAANSALTELNARLQQVLDVTPRLTSHVGFDDLARLVLECFVEVLSAAGGEIFIRETDALRRIDSAHINGWSPRVRWSASGMADVARALETRAQVTRPADARTGEPAVVMFPIASADQTVGAVVALYDITAPRDNWPRLGELLAAFSAESLRSARLADAARAAERRRNQGQKMEAIGRLAGGIAHDVNNTLTVIMGATELVRDRLQSIGDAGKAATEDLDVINYAARHAADLTRDLLTVARLQPMRAAAIRPAELVRRLSAMLDRTVGDHVRLALESTRSSRPVSIDQHQLERVLINLVTNARDAMPNGGSVSITTEDLDVPESPCTPPDRSGEFVRISVADEGIGMDAETQSRIFEPYFTKKKHGTGLGLAAAHGAIEQSGGYIEVETAPGVGSTFHVYLPSDNAAENPPMGRDDTPSFRGQGHKTLLVVEDDPSVRKIAIRHLERMGHRVIEASSGAEALALLERLGAVDIVLTDIVMPGMSGLELASKIRDDRPSTKLIFMTAHHNPAHDERMADVRLLTKPFTIAQLAVALWEGDATTGDA